MSQNLLTDLEGLKLNRKKQFSIFESIRCSAVIHVENIVDQDIDTIVNLKTAANDCINAMQRESIDLIKLQCDIQRTTDALWETVDKTGLSQTKLKSDKKQFATDHLNLVGQPVPDFNDYIKDLLSQSTTILRQFVQKCDKRSISIQAKQLITLNSDVFASLKGIISIMEPYQNISPDTILTLPKSDLDRCRRKTSMAQNTIKHVIKPFFDKLATIGFDGKTYVEFPTNHYTDFLSIQELVAMIAPLVDAGDNGYTSNDDSASSTSSRSSGRSKKHRLHKRHALSGIHSTIPQSKTPDSNPIQSGFSLCHGMFLKEPQTALMPPLELPIGTQSITAQHIPTGLSGTRDHTTLTPTSTAASHVPPPRVNSDLVYTSLEDRQKQRMDDGVIDNLWGTSKDKCVKLPHIDPPTFHGNRSEYPRFKRQFRQIYESRASGQAVLASYLLSAVGRKSKTGIMLDSLACVDGQYDSMWRKLDDKYGDQTASYANFLVKLEELTHKKLGESDKYAFVHFVEQVENIHARLFDLDPDWLRQVPLYTVTQLATCLPVIHSLKWDSTFEKMDQYERLYPFSSFVHFLAKRRSKIESTMIFDKAIPPKKELRGANNDKSLGSHHQQANSSSKKNDAAKTLPIRYPCNLCATGKKGKKTADHVLWKCEKFESMSLTDRRKAVMDNKLCVSCLRPFDAKKHKCPEFCHKDIYTCQEPGCAVKKHTKRISCKTLGRVTMSTSHLLTSRVSIIAVCLASLAIDICLQGIQNTLNAFFDDGSDSTFIMEKVAKRCKFEIMGVERINVKTLSGQILHIKSKIYKIPFLTERGPTFVYAYSINDYITSKLRLLDLAFLNTMFPGCETLLANCQRDTNRPVEILMGLDCFGLHPRKTIYSSEDGNLQIVTGLLGNAVVGSYPCSDNSSHNYTVTRVFKVEAKLDPKYDTKHDLANLCKYTHNSTKESLTINKYTTANRQQQSLPIVKTSLTMAIDTHVDQNTNLVEFPQPCLPAECTHIPNTKHSVSFKTDNTNTLGNDIQCCSNNTKIQPSTSKGILKTGNLNDVPISSCVDGNHNIDCCILSTNPLKTDNTLESDVSRFIKGEDLGVAIVPKCGGCLCKKCPTLGHDFSFKEEQELLMIRQGIHFDLKQGRFVANYPWILPPSCLPDNSWQCQKILQSTEQKLLKNPQWGEKYQEQMLDLLKRNASRKLSPEEISSWTKPYFYLSHMAVKNAKSTSTPLRVVFNSSNKAGKSGISLNSCLAKGPEAYMNKLHAVLMRFRQYNMAFIGDISKMYHSVALSIDDQHCHRFYWRDLDTSRDPDTYVMTRVNMGDVPAAAIAQECVYKTAEDFGSDLPEASDAVRHSTYVDDLDHSSDKNPDETLILVNQIHNLLKRGNFCIKEWWLAGEARGRTPEELSIPYGELSDNAPTESKLKASSLGGARVLGQGWHPQFDTLHFECPLNFKSKGDIDAGEPNLKHGDFAFEFPLTLTRRLVLRQTMRIYDPLGLLTPFLLQAKLLLRKTWDTVLKLGWDDAIPLPLHVEWKAFFLSCFELEDISFPRSVKPQDAVGLPSLVIFSDGSELAYGCCVYIRWKTSTAGFTSNLLFSKGRVAPLHRTSIPQMELNGAVLACRARKTCLKDLNYTFDSIIHLVDSETVLFQLTDVAARYHVYEGGRIGEIQSSEYLDSWHWLPGELNIADIMTRGKTPLQLINETNWLHGPEFLKQEIKDWPIKSIETIRTEKGSPLIPGLKKQKQLELFHIAKAQSDLIQYERFSNLNRCLRSIAYIMLAVRAKFKAGNIKAIGNKVLERARLFAIREAQKALASDVYYQNPSKKTGKSLGGKYKSLHALLTRQNIWVVGARSGDKNKLRDLYTNDLPILLPYGHHLTYLLMSQAHKESGHTGRDRTLQFFQKQYHCIRGSRLASKVSGACKQCIKLNPKIIGQAMGPLPPLKLAPAPLFTHVQVDIFGPYTVRGEVNKRSSRKGYGVLFVDMVCRAIHIEFIPDYSTESFLSGFSRFCALRGKPTDAYSDPGSQIDAGSKNLQDPWGAIDQLKVKEAGLKPGIGVNWHFSPADSPHRQGLVESMIKTVKKAAKSLSCSRLSFSEWLTLFYEVMDIINERPLSTHGIDPKTGSVTVITPNSLIMGRNNKSPAHRGEFSSKLLPRLSEVDRLVTVFWDKWLTCVKPALLTQKKWNTEVRNLQIGDIVLVLKSSKLSREYTLAMVHKVFPSESDGLVRKVELMYKRLKNTESGLPKYTGSSEIRILRSVQTLILLVPTDELDAQT